MRISDWSSDVCSSDLTHCDAAFWQPCFSEGGRRALKQALLADFDVVPAPSDEICDGQAAKAGSVEETGDAVCDRSDDRSGDHVDQQRAREYAEIAFAICGHDALQGRAARTIESAVNTACKTEPT